MTTDSAGKGTERTAGPTHDPETWQFYWRLGEGDEKLHADCGIFAEPRQGQAYSICRAPRHATKDEWERNAAFIVRACNSHDELVAALEAELAHHESKRQYRFSWDSYHKERAEIIRSALAAARP